MLNQTSVKLHDLAEIINTVLDARDPYTFEHSARVARLAELTAERMNLDTDLIDLIHMAAHLHDIGKVGVPDTVLNKAGRLTDEEYRLIQAHSRIGYNIVRQIEPLQEAAEIVLQHHERWDGAGYPLGTADRAIPLGARIICIADSFDAMTSHRSYRSAMTFEKAFAEIRCEAGRQFCPDSAAAFLTLEKEMDQILDQVNREIMHSAFTDQEESREIRGAWLEVAAF